MKTNRPQPHGVGIGLRRPHHDTIVQTERRVDWLEIVPENFACTGGNTRRQLDACAERWPILAHGVSLSLGGRDPLDGDYIKNLRTLLDDLGAPFYTDHLCYGRIDGVAFHDLLPLPFTFEAARHCAARVRELSDRLERPIALENISYYAAMPSSAMTHGQFVRAVLEEADCGLLLDVNNVFVNARNHGGDPNDWLSELPLERTMQIHVAGHVPEDGRLVDNHGAPVVDEVWTLLESALERVGEVPVLLEWDTDVPPLDRVLDEADRAREIYDAVRQRSGGGAS